MKGGGTWASTKKKKKTAMGGGNRNANILAATAKATRGGNTNERTRHGRKKSTKLRIKRGPGKTGPTK